MDGGTAGMTNGMEMPTKPRGKSFKHCPDKHLPGSAMVSMYATDQTASPGIGLQHADAQVMDVEKFGTVTVDQLEIRNNDSGGNTLNWDIQGWYGGKL